MDLQCGGHIARSCTLNVNGRPHYKTSKRHASAFRNPLRCIFSNSVYPNEGASASAFQAQDLKGQRGSTLPQELIQRGPQHYSRPCIFSGTANLPLAQTQGRESIAAKLVANLITEAGANRVLACDLHSGQSMGYFDIPVDHVYGQPVILDYLASKITSSRDLVVVSPDVGGVARARAFAKKLSDAPLAIVDKRRHGHNVSEVMNLIGDVKGKVAVMVDDMIDTAGTITNGAALLHQEGAREVYACSTHAVFSPPAIERLSGGLFQEVIITNTIPIKDENYFPQLTILSVANLLGETIWRVYDDGSMPGKGSTSRRTSEVIHSIPCEVKEHAFIPIQI